MAATLALTAPLFGVALARPLLDLISQARAALRERAYAAVEGRYFAHKGVPVDVVEGTDGHRWLRVAEVRRLMHHGKPPSAYLQDDALLEQLARAMAPATVAFRHWVERDIVFPARRRRGERDAIGVGRSPGDPTLAAPSEPHSAP